MYCGVCQYSWCWTCGFESYNWFHKIQGNGFFCDCVNALAYGFEVKIHWIFRVILSILAIAFMPVIGLFALVFVYIADMNGGRHAMLVFDCARGCNCCVWLLVFPLGLAWMLTVLALAIAVSSVIIAIAVGPAYLLLFLVLIMSPIRFFCCPKRK